MRPRPKDVLRPAVRVLTVLAVAVGLLLPAGAAVAAAPVPMPGTTLVLSVSTTRVTHGSDLRLTATLRSAETGLAVPDAEVVLEHRRPGSGAYAPLATLVTDAAGVVRLVTKPTFTAEYAARFAGNGVLAPSATAAQRVDVAHNLTARLSKAAARVGSQVTLTGSVSPAHPGATVRIERYFDGRWRLVTSRTLSSASTYRALLTTPTTKGWTRYRVVMAADRDHLAKTTALPRLDSFRLHTYVVAKRGTVGVSMPDFAAAVAATYADPRGWVRGHDRFRQVTSGGRFTVVMSQARYLPSYSSVCSVQYSCRVGRYVIINQDRWRYGSRYFTGSLAQYRQMVVNHETGHWLGNGHAYCRGKGRPAPVMQQQSKGMQGCEPNAWPLTGEL